MTDKAERSRDEDATEFLSHLRPEELDRLAKFSRMDDAQFARIERVTRWSEEEYALMTKGVDMVRSFLTVGRLLRWFFMGVIGFFVAIYGFVEVVMKIKSYIGGVPR